MRNIENLMQIIRDSKLAVPKHYHLMDQISKEDYAYFARDLGVGADEKILFSIGGYIDELHHVIPLCVTDKQLHITGHDSTKDIFHIPLDDIQSAKLGEAEFETTATDLLEYKGRPVIINGEHYALVLQQYKEHMHTSSTMIELVLGVISGVYTEQTLLAKLSTCDEGLAERLNSPFSIFIYILFIVISFGFYIFMEKDNFYYSYIPSAVMVVGIYIFLEMVKVKDSLNMITAKHNDPPIGSYFKAVLRSIPTLGITGLVWRMAFLNRIKLELHRRDLPEGEKFSPFVTWLWGFVPYLYVLLFIGSLCFSKYLALPDLTKGYTGFIVFAIAFVCEIVFRYNISNYMTILVNDYNKKG